MCDVQAKDKSDMIKQGLGWTPKKVVKTFQTEYDCSSEQAIKVTPVPNKITLALMRVDITY